MRARSSFPLEEDTMLHFAFSDRDMIIAQRFLNATNFRALSASAATVNDVTNTSCVRKVIKYGNKGFVSSRTPERFHLNDSSKNLGQCLIVID